MEAAKRKRVILIAVSAVLLVAVGIGAGYLLGKGRADDGGSDGTKRAASKEPTETVDTTSSAESTIPASSAQTDTGTPAQGDTAKNADDGRQIVFIKKLYLKGGHVWATVDFLQLFTGGEADVEAAKHGQEAPNGYYVLNDNPKLREFAIRDDATIVTAFGGDPAEEATLKPQELYDWSINEDGLLDYRLFWITILNGEVTGIKHMWVP